MARYRDQVCVSNKHPGGSFGKANSKNIELDNPLNPFQS